MRAALPIQALFHLGRRRQRQSGVVLLEVVLALALFVAAAAVIGNGLSRSAAEVDRLRLRTHALDLALSVVSELQIGIRPLRETGPEPFVAPFQDWTYKIELEPLINANRGESISREPLVNRDSPDELPPAWRARVTVHHEEPDIVQQLVETIPAAVLAHAANDEATGAAASPAPANSRPVPPPQKRPARP